MEAGGHIGKVYYYGTLPQVVDALNIPVIGAGGGIGDRRGMAAAQCLVPMQFNGTRFLVATECAAHDN